MSSKFAIENENVLYLLGDFVPQTLTGAPPLYPAGGLPFPIPLTCAVQKFPLKSPGLEYILFDLLPVDSVSAKSDSSIQAELVGVYSYIHCKASDL